MGKIKLVSDFDGIWTNQELEADYVWNYIINKISQLTKLSIKEADLFLNEVKAEMDAEPYKYGWFNNGKIACYYREDPFGDNNAIFDYFGKIYNKSNNSPLAEKIIKIGKNILDGGYSSFDIFSNNCFFESTGKFKEEGRLLPHHSARKVLDELFNNNVQVVVASNSKTTKIEYLFSLMGIDIEDKNKFYARGNSMKFVIENEFSVVPEILKIDSDYNVNLRRQAYYNVLYEEMPDYVIGDVFSLDLSLPLYLRINDSRFKNLKVIQKVQKHTPDWVKNFLSKNEFKGIAYMIDDIEEIRKVIMA
jgi:hypothetical protein